MVNAGVDFGKNYNEKYEDRDLLNFYFNLIDMDGLSSKWSNKSKILRDWFITYQEKEVWGFKHPQTSMVIDGWLDALPNLKMIAIVRDFWSWCMAMMRDNHIDLFYPLKIPQILLKEELGKHWCVCYDNVLRLAAEGRCEVVMFNYKDTEQQIESAFGRVGLTYQGGYDAAKPSIMNFEEIPTSQRVRETYNALRDIALTSR